MSGGPLNTGELASVLCALLWAVAIVLFRVCGERVPPVALNLFKNTVAIVLFPISMAALGVPFMPADASAMDWQVLLISGAVGIGIADTMLFYSLNRIGAGRSAIIASGYCPCVIVCSALYLHEPVGPMLVVAVVMMVVAVFIGSRIPGRIEHAVGGRDFKLGVAAGTVAMVLMSVGVVIAKPVLDHADAWWASGVRLLGGMIVLVAQAALPRYRREIVECFRPSRLWLVTVPAAIVGSYLATFFWILGMKHTMTTTASVLNQLSPIFLLVLATLFLRERLTGRKAVAIAIGFVGAMVAVLEA
jgi:drug/metabolite transporter (DMT)-like permease